MSQVSQILNNVIENLESTDADDGSERIYIQIDDVIALIGSIWDYQDVVKEFGNLSFIYNRLVHPLIAELVNGVEAIPLKDVDHILADILRYEKSGEVAEHIHKSLDSKIWLILNNPSHQHVKVPIETIKRVAVAMFNVVAGDMLELVADRKEATFRQGGFNHISFILNERSSSQLIPDVNPFAIQVYFTFNLIGEE